MSADLLADIEMSIAALERVPRMFGSPETQEAMMLTLVDIRASLTRPMAMVADPYELRHAYQFFVCSVNGESTNWFLHSVLKEEGMLDMLPTLLGDFARWVAIEYPPETGEPIAGTDGMQCGHPFERETLAAFRSRVLCHMRWTPNA